MNQFEHSFDKQTLSGELQKAVANIKRRWPQICANVLITLALTFVFLFLAQVAAVILNGGKPPGDDTIGARTAAETFLIFASWVGEAILAPLATTAVGAVATAGAATAAVVTATAQSADSASQLDDLTQRLETAEGDRKRLQGENAELAAALERCRAGQAGGAGPVAPPDGRLEELSFMAPAVYEGLLKLKLHLENFRRRQPTVEEMLEALRSAQIPCPFSALDEEAFPLVRDIVILIKTINAVVARYTAPNGPPRHTIVVEAVIATLSVALERDMRVLEEKLNELAAKNRKTAEPRDRMKELYFAFHKYSR